ncbi:MAG TPA: hypothetical protein PLK94_00855 [Alphaproteobacteria bacterium]|nr:hypothetical protein [Alphaproteobacteria bacterium]
MKKLFAIVMMLAVVMTAFALQVTYTNSSGADVFVEGRWVEAGDTVIFDHYVYDDALTYTSVAGDPIVLASTSVATTAAATTTVTVDQLADVTVLIDVGSTNIGELTLYFNDADNTALTLDASWTYDANTKWFDRLIIVNTATTTAYDVLITRRF